MQVPINNDYRISSDAYNIILEQKFIVQEGKNKGNEYWQATGFYPTIRQALEGYVNVRQRKSGAKTWVGLEKLTKQLYGEIQAISEALGISMKENKDGK